MCLAIPMKIEGLSENVACASLGGTTRNVYLDLMSEEVAIGDYVLVHAGFAIHRIDPHEAEETLRLFQEAGVLASSSETGS
jgi:hydrogenase expression/formation protein HypC